MVAIRRNLDDPFLRTVLRSMRSNINHLITACSRCNPYFKGYYSYLDQVTKRDANRFIAPSENSSQTTSMPDWIPRTADAANAAGAASASAGGTKRAPEPDRVGRRAVRRRRICTQAKFKPDAGRGRPKRRNAGLFGARGGGRDPLGAARPTAKG